MMETKRCWSCKEVKLRNSENFYSYFDKSRGHYRIDRRCKACSKKYRPGHTGPARRDRIKFPRKAQNRLAVAKAIRTGVLKKPLDCEKCGSRSKLHAHHPDHRSALRVVWLCIPCHTFIHRVAA